MVIRHIFGGFVSFSLPLLVDQPNWKSVLLLNDVRDLCLSRMRTHKIIMVKKVRKSALQNCQKRNDKTQQFVIENGLPVIEYDVVSLGACIVCVFV